MRIICPNCDAQYEVGEDAIPPEGRDVQCSNCGNAWFQERADLAEKLTSSLYQPPDELPEASQAIGQGEEEREVPPAPAPVRRSLDDAVLQVLREEAEREVSARKAEAQGLEMQGELGLPPPVSPAVGSSHQKARDEGEETPEIPANERRMDPVKGTAAPSPKPVARRDLLPDIEEINSTLKPGEKILPSGRLGPEEAAQARSGFRSGFSLMLLIAVIGVALYVMAPQISQQIPGLAATMETYVAAVDALRLSLDGLIRQATGFLKGLAGSA